MGCSTYVEFSKIDNAILGIPFGGSTTDWIVSRYLLTLRLLSHPIEPVELRVDAETEADGQLLLLQEGWKRLYKSITACNGIWGTETPFPESMHVLAYSMAAQWTSLLLIKLFRMLQSRLSRAGYVDATSAGLSPEHSQLPSNLILPPSIDTIPLAQIYADPENDKSALLSDCFGSFEASYRFAVSHLKTMATKQFMEDDWVGYYSCCNAQDTPWDMTFDGPMQGIKFSTSSSPPNHRHDMTLRSNGYDVVGAFQLFGSLNTNTGYFHLIKRYEAQPVVWNWEGRLTPWGLVGVWGRHAPSQWGGLFWLWKSSWSRPAPPGMVLEKGRGGTENLAGQISIMMFQAVSREETEVGLMWNP
ncbi:hypothetical protein P152DRAFT_233777 [Eremomyces bilateralis CBS 781.70]|uniref:Uncharacterized protein n=1 Tax=Eremomyces bilateralis CBS 781.70 TaxID=1392243 RepID=A0A6G1GAF5_9PEZI|nr:uncharacterized protein P152DRAFT_233777 [Eremomyces bilateralis CBS 781.70]KAF1814819.1 hypothetical protein P152DRAFT_233777 [Eremomyces bilateralis CBS 781.70]